MGREWRTGHDEAIEALQWGNPQQQIAGKPLVEIEVLATAAWIRANEQFHTSEEMASRLHILKPYVSADEAIEKVGQIEGMISGARQVPA